MAIRFWPTVLTTSARLSPALVSLTGMSPTVPVIVPPGSPFAWSAGEGPLMPLMSPVVTGTDGGGAGEAAADGEAAWTGALAKTNVLGKNPAKARNKTNTFISLMRD